MLVSNTEKHLSMKIFFMFSLLFLAIVHAVILPDHIAIYIHCIYLLNGHFFPKIEKIDRNEP